MSKGNNTRIVILAFRSLSWVVNNENLWIVSARPIFSESYDRHPMPVVNPVAVCLRVVLVPTNQNPFRAIPKNALFEPAKLHGRIIHGDKLGNIPPADGSHPFIFDVPVI